MAMSLDDIRYRDSRANQILGIVLGHSAVGLIRAEIRKVYDGWLYWGIDSFVFFANEQIFNGSRELHLDYDFVKIPKSKYLLYNGELVFESIKPPLVFHSSRGRIKLIEKAINDHFNRI
ncbi:unannotated protein [freshwater metagenome]|uniref:Unannotated protein n=1 Tax=freshwater metagenome TaxID=449393 RepID=A0A6J6U9D0_9ZZZZ|nr:hypothetical protein [Actinomycetota bacterium]